MKFKKTMRERYPRKTKKFLLKHYSRAAYSEVIHLQQRIVEAQVSHYIAFYTAPHPEIDAIVAELRESAKSQPKSMSKDEEIAYILGDSDVSASLVESVDRCCECGGFETCSGGMFPAMPGDSGCRWFSRESIGEESCRE